MSNELTVIKRAEIALNTCPSVASLMELAGSTKHITVITNKAGRQECHAAAMALAATRIEIARVSKSACDDLQAFCKELIAKTKDRVGIIQPEEDRLKAVRDEYDAKIEAERAALKAEREKLEAEKVVAAKKWLDDRIELERQQSEILAQNARIAYEQRALDEQMREELARQEAEESDRQKRQDLSVWKEDRDANLDRRAHLSSLTPPTLQQITRLVADHFADGDYATAERWMNELWK